MTSEKILTTFKVGNHLNYYEFVMKSNEVVLVIYCKPGFLMFSGESKGKTGEKKVNFERIQSLI